MLGCKLLHIRRPDISIGHNRSALAPTPYLRSHALELQQERETVERLSGHPGGRRPLLVRVHHGKHVAATVVEQVRNEGRDRTDFS